MRVSTWGKDISTFQAPDLHPMSPRITVREPRTLPAPTVRKYQPPRWYRRMMLSVIYQALTDYHWAKGLQKRRGITTPEQVADLPKWDRETIATGKAAYEWFIDKSEGRMSFKAICHEFGVNPEKLWRKIKKNPQLLNDLQILRYEEAFS